MLKNVCTISNLGLGGGHKRPSSRDPHFFHSKKSALSGLSPIRCDSFPNHSVERGITVSLCFESNEVFTGHSAHNKKMEWIKYLNQEMVQQIN